MSNRDLLAETARRQSEASDPQRSAWVSANAGAGKTHVLKLRVLRLLLAETSPDRILCVAYTKAAAAEMSKRVFDDLSRWATATDATLRLLLKPVLGRHADDADMVRARRLFAHAIETPGGLKVQTIHGFCERLLQRFPLEAGIPPGFSVLDDDAAAALRREAIDAVLRQATSAPSQPLGRALTCVIAHAVDDRFDDVLGAAIARREWLRWLIRLGDDEDSALATADDIYRDLLSVRRTVSADALRQDMAHVLDDTGLRRATDLLCAGKSTEDKKIATGLRTALRSAISPAGSPASKPRF